MSSRRSSNWIAPSSVILATSPVCSQPSDRVRAVASGRFQ
jgi:hypothetical protein